VKIICNTLPTVETVDNGKAIRESLAADIPLAIDHFRYFASVIEPKKAITEPDASTVSPVLSELWA
jgi:aldehyde dehydrogenase